MTRLPFHVLPYPSAPRMGIAAAVLAILWAAENLVCLCFVMPGHSQNAVSALAANMAIFLLNAGVCIAFDPHGILGRVRRDEFRWTATDCRWFGVGIAGFIAANMILELNKILFRTLKIPFVEEQQLSLLLKNGAGREILMAVLLSVLVAPVAEEILFRRTLFGAFLPMGKGRAMLFCGALFALLHFYPVGFIALFLIGIVLQIVYLNSGKLSVPVAVHIAGNAGAMLLTLSGWF